MNRIEASMHDMNLAACHANLPAHYTNGEPEIPPGAPPEAPPEEVPIEIPPSGPPEIGPEPSELPPANPPEVPQSTSASEQKTMAVSIVTVVDRGTANPQVAAN